VLGLKEDLGSAVATEQFGIRNVMELRDIILQIGAGFAEASTQPLADNPLAGMIRSEVPPEFARILGASELTFTGSPGQGN
jgi:hypothetical protein